MPRVEIVPGIFAELDVDGLAELKNLRDANPLTGYFPFAHQRKFHEAVGAKTPIVALFAGNRAGKTECSVADDLIQLLPRDLVPEHLRPYKRWDPPVHIWIGVPTEAKLEEVLIPKLRKLCPPSAFKGGGFDKAYSKQRRHLDFECGSSIGFKTFVQDVDAFSGAALHRMHWDEEPEGEHGRAIRQEARVRLIDYAGDEIFSMTPLLGLSFVFEEVWERRNEEHIAVVRASMDDNPTLDSESKRLALADATKEELKARRDGEFVHFRGRVYGEFDDEKHIVDPPEFTHVQQLDTVLGIDPGIRTTAIAFCGFDNDNSMLVYDELYLHDEDAIPENAARLIKQKCKAWGVDPMYSVIDPSARNRTLLTGTNIEDAYLRAGIPTLPGQNEVEAGVFEMKRRMQHSPTLLHVSRNCGVWIRECERYRMDDKADGRFAVVKQDDHLMDASRYVAMSRPIGPTGPGIEREQEWHFQGDAAPSMEFLRNLHPPTGSGAFPNL